MKNSIYQSKLKKTVIHAADEANCITVVLYNFMSRIRGRFLRFLDKRVLTI